MAVTRIQRGYACVSCHTRKKRCDGARPSCATCARSQLQCEYTDIPGEASSHRQIRTLLTRVNELEGILTNMGGHESSLRTGTESLHSGSGSDGSGSVSRSPPSQGIDHNSGEIASWLQDILLATMIANAHRYNLYLHVSTLESPPRPLLNAMNLVACHILTRSANLDTRPSLQELDHLKTMLLSRVYDGIHLSLENARDLLAGAVCAPALASQYLLEVGRFVEAQWLACNAIRFAVSSGIHTIGTHRWIALNALESIPSTRVSNSSLRSSGGSFLVPPRDAREHHDRLMTWWLAYATDGMVEVVARLPSALRTETLASLGDTEAALGGTRGILAVFPLPEHVYETGSYEIDLPGVNVPELLLGEISPDASSESAFAGRVKAFTFYHAAVVIDENLRTSGSFDQEMPSKIFRNISTFIGQFRVGISSFTNDLDVVLSCMLAHVATIRLYTGSPGFEDQRRRTEAASAIARLAVTLSEQEFLSQSQLLVMCCAQALQVLGSLGPVHDEAGARELQTLLLITEHLRN